MRIAAFGFRSFPPTDGSAGADKFALELLPRLADRGHQVVAYNRLYPDQAQPAPFERPRLEVRSFRTVKWAGFDTLLHSAKVTWDIIRHNRADVVHIQNGGNSIFAAVLRLFGKKTYLSQDGIDWKRDKWPWYAKLYLFLSSFLTSRVHNAVIFDNVFAREEFEQRFSRTYDFIPFGADVTLDPAAALVVEELGLVPGEYFLFVGRFIPDKGLHWLVPAFERLKTAKKLVLIGGSPNPSPYERDVRATLDPRIVMPGFLYGAKIHALMRQSFAYVQPSSIEGLSPVILEATYVGAPVICSDIPQNRFSLRDNGTYFRVGDIDDIARVLQAAIDDPVALRDRAAAAQADIRKRFSWDAVTDQHIELFAGRAPTDGASRARANA
ncbi:glycosyltransferase family 4 protein [Sphingomonas sp.]|uniref:glycosyltransferase family 4 protein n=1 Tax=Sphingomonas sp. TaxID=28214 RepID=UPI002ED85784